MNETEPSKDIIVNHGDEVRLTTNSSRRYRICRDKLRARRQVTPDITSELDLNDAQLNNLRAYVDRRFLTGYDCAKPREVQPISSFVQDPCEPAEANDKDTYEIDPPTQYQIVQYETRRELAGTWCERYVSQFTYYCGLADHASPLPQETYYRHPRIMTRSECKNLAQ